MKKLYVSASILFFLPSVFGQKSPITDNLVKKEKILSQLSTPLSSSDNGVFAPKEGSEKSITSFWKEDFGTAAQTEDTLTTAKGDWVQDANNENNKPNKVDSTYWKLTTSHTLPPFTDAFDGAFLAWDSYGPINEPPGQDGTTPVTGSIISPAIDLSSVNGGVIMKFKTDAMYFADGNNFPFKISVSEDDGVSWSQPLTLDFGADQGQPTSAILKPLPVTVDISNYTKLHNNKTKLKFIWDGSVANTAQQYNTYYYWLIDDIELYEKPEYDLVLENLWLNNIVTDFEYTSLPSEFAGPLTVQAKVRNLGSSVPSNPKIKVTVKDLDNKTLEEETGGDYLNGLNAEYDTITFQSTIDLSNLPIGTYKVTGELIFDGGTDENATDNTKTRTIKITNGIYGQQDFEQKTFIGSVGKDYANGSNNAPMGFGSVFYVPTDATLQGVNVYIGNSNFYKTTTGLLEVNIYTYDPNLLESSNPFQSFQDAHKPYGASNRLFEIKPDMVPLANQFKVVTLNFNNLDQGPELLEGGKYYIALLEHAGFGTSFAYIENPFDYDLSNRIKGDFAATAGSNWINHPEGRQILTELNFDKSLSTTEINSDLIVGSIAPNPTSGLTTIKFSLTNPQDVTLEVVDLTGKKVYSKVEKGLSAGSHFVSFDASNLRSGVYYVNIKTEKSIRKQKFVKD